jgi:hypothetical protein
LSSDPGHPSFVAGDSSSTHGARSFAFFCRPQFPAGSLSTIVAMTSTVRPSILLLAVVAGVAIFVTVRIVRQHAAIADVSARIVQLRSESLQLRSQQAATAQRVQTAKENLANLPQANLESDAEIEQVANAWLARISRMKELAANRTDLVIPECEVLTEEQWFAAAREGKLDSDEAISGAFKALRATARESLARLLLRAVRRYVDDHEGLLPGAPAMLADFLDRPLSPALLERFQFMQRGALDAATKEDWILAERAALTTQRDNRIYVTASDSGTEDLDNISDRELRLALRAFAAANAGQLPTDPAQLLSFFPDAPRRSALEKFLAQPKADFAADKLKQLLAPR